MKALTIQWDGKQISRPGLYSGIPLSLYHSPYICAGPMPIPQGSGFGSLKTFGPSASSSMLRNIFGPEKSPKHFFAQWPGNPNYNPTPEEIEGKRHFVIGRAIHHLLLGERNFGKLFCLQPAEYPDSKSGELKPWNYNAEYCKVWRRERLAEGRSPLSPREVEAIKQMAYAAGNHPFVRDGALNGYIERSLFWRDEETGVWLKARPDSIPRDSADFVDLKTIYFLSRPALIRAMREHAYYRQAALIREGCSAVLKMKMESFFYIFVEKKPPWHTMDIQCYAKDMALGDQENRAAIRIFAKCMETGHWPGPGEGNEGNEFVGLSQEVRDSIKLLLKHEAGIEAAED